MRIRKPFTDTGIDYRLAALTLLVCLILAELLLAWRGPAWALQRRGLPLHSQGLLQDRLRAAAGKPVLLLLGDSVFYGTALREHGIQAWPDQTPPAFLAERLPAYQVLDLSDEGLFPEDLLALEEAAQVVHPQAVVLQLNYRMFGEDAGGVKGALTRPFLQSYLPKGFEGPPDPRPWLDLAALSAWMEGHWCLLRYAGAWAEQALPGGTKRWMSGPVQAWFAEQDTVDPDVLLNLKIRPYYQAPVMDPHEHRGLMALEALAQRLAQQGVPTLVFLAPQNLERVSDFMDRAAYKKNLALVAHAFQRSGIRYADWSAERPGRFLDHCHLDPAGNQALAQRIVRELKL